MQRRNQNKTGGAEVLCFPPPLFFLSGDGLDTIRIVIDDAALLRYEKQYFKIHKRATKKPIKHPYHESINEWFIMRRPMMNALKQRWKDFIVWLINEKGYTNLRIDKCELSFQTYYMTGRRHDVDNSCPKFIIDGLVESGFLVDDDSIHVRKLTLECFVDRGHPRTEIRITVLSTKGEENNGQEADIQNAEASQED